MHSIFHVRDDTGGLHETILPKANVDVLFNLGAPLEATDSRTMTRLEHGRAQLAGVQTAGFRSRPDGAMNLVGVSLRMEHAAALLPCAPGDLTDRRIDAALVLPETAFLVDALAGARDATARRRLLLRWIDVRMQPRERDALLRNACAALRRRPTDARVASLAREAGMSPRHFQRVFTAAIGLTPSRYAKMRRFVRALHLIPRMPTLTGVAHEACYTDHAHFCRDFREFAGMTPDAYRRSAGLVPGHVVAGGVSDSYNPPVAGFDIMPEQEAPTDDRTTPSHSR